MTLNYQPQIQLLDHWCWAAVSSSIAKYYNPLSSWSQSALAGALISPDCATITPANAGSPPPACDVTNDLSEVLAFTGNRAWVVEGPLTLAQVQGQLGGGWPICCQIRWPQFDMAHFVTLYGYSGTTIYVGDPQSGNHAVDYNVFVNAYRQGVWSRTIGTSASHK